MFILLYVYIATWLKKRGPVNLRVRVGEEHGRARRKERKGANDVILF